VGRGSRPFGPMSTEEWPSFHAFNARLLGSGLDALERPAVFAIWAFRDALEEPHDPPGLGDCYVITAAQWILYAGKALFSDRTQPRDAKDRALNGGSLFRRPPGMSLGRWHFWRSRFRKLSSQLGDKARQEAERSVAVMEDIEKGEKDVQTEPSKDAAGVDPSGEGTPDKDMPDQSELSRDNHDRGEAGEEQSGEDALSGQAVSGEHIAEDALHEIR